MHVLHLQTGGLVAVSHTVLLKKQGYRSDESQSWGTYHESISDYCIDYLNPAVAELMFFETVSRKWVFMS